LPSRLVLSGGFTVDDARHRHLDQQARRLGFADLRACLQALLDDGWSIPQLATHLHHPAGHPPRQHAAQQRATASANELGFPSVRAYLVDRLVTKAWTLAETVQQRSQGMRGR